MTLDVTDYSKPEHRLSMSGYPRKPVDVFYVYPTTYIKANGESTYCTINNLSMLKGSPGAFNSQATTLGIGQPNAPENGKPVRLLNMPDKSTVTINWSTQEMKVVEGESAP